MEAGRELDALIAEKVMGWIHNPPGIRGMGWLTPEYKMIGDHALPAFSTDIAAAWQVVLHMIPKHETSFDRPYGINGAWSCRFLPLHTVDYGTVEAGDLWKSAETAPHAICLAALAAMKYIPPS